LEKLRMEFEENLRFEKLTHEREINKLSAEHQDEIQRLNEEKNAIQEELSKIEATYDPSSLLSLSPPLPHLLSSVLLFTYLLHVLLFLPC
jgi:hypothetical protein